VVKPTPSSSPRPTPKSSAKPMSKSSASAKGVRKRSPNRGFYVALGLLAVAGVGTLAYVATRGGDRQVVQLDPNLPPVQSEGYVIGSPSAPVEVIEFADFECPACAQFATLHEPDVRSRLVQTGQIRLRFLDLPLVEIGHRNSPTASLAAACANEQGKFWEMHDAIFAVQDRWATQTTGNPRAVIDPLARQVGLDVRRYEECMSSRRYLANIQAHRQAAQRYKVQSTPSFVIGGRVYSGNLPYDEFKRYVDQARAAGTTSAPGAAAPSAAPASRP
jgi:protein-disulfide isomerase